MSRVIGDIVESREQMEGAGVPVRRSIGNTHLRNLDPFLMLDEFKPNSLSERGGMPDHPHRGFETVTYMLKGASKHEDFCGHKGVINAGDVQWMTAGRGIVHSEMPAGDELVHGLQLWVNLCKKDKMVKPAYQELRDKDIPKVIRNGVTVKIIAGESFGVKSPVYTRTPSMYLDFKLDAGAVVSQTVPEGWNGFVYVISGSAMFGPNDQAKNGPAHCTLVMGPGKMMEVKNNTNNLCHFVMIAGQPIKEPIVQHGPFVMNTQKEIQEAIEDYHHGRNGFENAKTWRSSAKRR
ncbi:hypothetical protein ACF0H5_006316 [Mactra antiquata]